MFRRRLDAQQFLTAKEGAKLRGEWIDPRRSRTPFAEWAAQIEAGRNGRRASTIARDESIMRTLVLPSFGALPLSAIEPSTVRAWLTERIAAGYASATVRKAYQLLAGALEQALDDGLIPRSPCRRIELPRVEDQDMRFLTPEQIQALADAIAPRYRALVLTAAYAGCRFGELAALTPAHLDLLRRSLRVEETLNEVRGELVVGPPKTKASRRTVSLPAFLGDVLAEHLAAFPVGEAGYVFSSPKGAALRRNAFRRRAWVPAVRASVGEPCRFHDLRHSHAALLIAQGVHPKVIQERLGHASIRTTLDTYGHAFEGLDEAAADGLDATWRGALADLTRTRRGPEVVSLGRSGT